MNQWSDILRLRRFLLRVARHLQVIVFVLFLLYLLVAAVALSMIHEIPSPGAAIGLAIFLFGPLLLFLFELSAVCKLNVAASYLCALLWLIVAVWLYAASVVAIDFAVTVVLFASGSMAILLAFLHKLWPELVPLPSRTLRPLESPPRLGR